ncbi:hypothetical protein BS78_05G230600 [Paspalum vaginatum]|nr:hypothetical protein BS78_05G230600 [Paspalum vaginatum]
MRAPIVAPHGSHRSGRGTSSSFASCSGGTSSGSSLVKDYSHTPTSSTPHQLGCAASSPRLISTRRRAQVAHQLRFGMSWVTWPWELTDFFITALLDECRAGNRGTTTLNRVGKDHVLQRLRDHTRRDWSWDTCKNKWDELKKKWSCWKRLNQFSGLGFHPRTGVIEMPEKWWAK